MSETTETAVTPAEAQELEAAAGHFVTATLRGADDASRTVEIIPSGAWRQSAMRKLKSGDVDAFMEAVLSPESYELYLDLDPTNDQVGELVNSVGDAAGEPLGKSSGPKGSSKPTRKR